MGVGGGDKGWHDGTIKRRIWKKGKGKGKGVVARLLQKENTSLGAGSAILEESCLKASFKSLIEGSVCRK